MGLQERFQLGELEGFGEMVIHAGIQRSLQILILAITGDGYEQGIGELRLAPQGAGDLKAIHPGQPDVEQDHLGPIGSGHIHRTETVIGQTNLMAPNFEHLPHGQGGVSVLSSTMSTRS